MNRRYRLERGFLPFTSLFAILAAVAIGPVHGHDVEGDFM